jgi:RNA polymerase sigma factor (sigma-70 family)
MTAISLLDMLLIVTKEDIKMNSVDLFEKTAIDIAADVPDPDSPDPEAELVKAETRDQIHSMLKDLDATDRAAIIMRYWYDFSEAEVARSLRLTVSAVKNRLHRALKELARLWQEEELLSTTEKRLYESPAF